MGAWVSHNTECPDSSPEYDSDSSNDLVQTIDSDEDSIYGRPPYIDSDSSEDRPPYIDSDDNSSEDRPHNSDSDSSIDLVHNSDSDDNSSEDYTRYIYRAVDNRTCLVNALIQAGSSIAQEIPDTPNVRVWSLWSPDSNMTYDRRANRESLRFMSNISKVMTFIMDSENDAFIDELIDLKVKHSPSAVRFHKTLLFGQSVVGDELARVLNALSELDVPHRSIMRFINSTCCNVDHLDDTHSVVDPTLVLEKLNDLSCLFGALRMGHVISRTLTESQYGARWFVVIRWFTSVVNQHLLYISHINVESPLFAHTYQVLSDAVSFITTPADNTTPHYSDVWEGQSYAVILQAIGETHVGRLIADTLSLHWLNILTGQTSSVIIDHPVHAACRIHFDFNILYKITKHACYQQYIQLPSQSCNWQMAQMTPANFCISIKSSPSIDDSNATQLEYVVSLHVHDWVMMQWSFFKRMFASQSEERQMRHLRLPCHFPVAVLEAVLAMCYRGGRDDLASERAFIEEFADEYELIDLLMINEVSPKPKTNR